MDTGRYISSPSVQESSQNWPMCMQSGVTVIPIPREVEVSFHSNLGLNMALAETWNTAHKQPEPASCVMASHFLYWLIHSSSVQCHSHQSTHFILCSWGTTQHHPALYLLKHTMRGGGILPIMLTLKTCWIQKFGCLK